MSGSFKALYQGHLTHDFLICVSSCLSKTGRCSDAWAGESRAKRRHGADHPGRHSDDIGFCPSCEALTSCALSSTVLLIILPQQGLLDFIGETAKCMPGILSNQSKEEMTSRTKLVEMVVCPRKDQLELWRSLSSPLMPTYSFWLFHYI